MHPLLDTLIERFRDAQDTSVRVLTEKLEIPQPTSDHDWPCVCIDHSISRRCRLQDVGIYTHGFGVELEIGDLTIDFDWGENGEPDRFDTWRLYKFTLDNGGPDSCSYDAVQRWLNDALAAGELTKSGSLYFDPPRRAVGRNEGTS